MEPGIKYLMIGHESAGNPGNRSTLGGRGETPDKSDPKPCPIIGYILPCLYPLAPHFPAGIVGIGIDIGLVLVLIGIRILLVLPINILTTSVFNALSIGSGLVVAVLLCMKRDVT